MTTVLSKVDREKHPDLFNQMFRARADVFQRRLRWDVTVLNGLEVDRYDETEDPIYLVTLEQSQIISGSLRLLPTTGPTMLSNEFASFFTEPVDVRCPTVWECTRFCVHPSTLGCSAQRQVSTRLLIGLCELCLSSGVEQIVGVYESCMSRIYGRIGWVPTVLARACHRDLSVGIWDVSEQALDVMRANLDRLKINGKLLSC